MRDSGLEEGHGEDRTQSRHTLNSLSFSFSPPPCFSRSNNVPSTLLCFRCSLPPHPTPSLSFFHIFITPFPLSISPRVSARVSAEDHTVFHITPQLMTNSNMEPLNLPPPPHPTPPVNTHSHSLTHTHTPFQLFLPPLKTSQHFFIYSPSPSVSLYLSPSQWIYLPRLITRSPNQRCMASPVMSVREKVQERV